MGKNKEPQKKILTKHLDLDLEKLFGTLTEAIKYLSEIREAHRDKQDLSIQEHRTGYEDWEFRFEYTIPETDEEFASRLKQEEHHRKRAEEERQREAAKAERKKKWEALNKEFGRGY